MSAAAAPFLSVRDVRKSFGAVEILHGVSLDVAGGSVLALLGENGAGKSTLVRTIAGDHQPDSGEVLVEGRPLGGRDVGAARRRGIRLISQEIADAPPLTVAENVALGDWPARRGLLSPRRLRRETAEALAALGVELDLDAPVSTLRMGERQAVEIARALRGDGRCLIFDEPTAALSDAEAERLFAVIAGLRARGVAIVYITHRLDEVFRIADAVCVLRDGEVVLREPIAAVDRDAIVRAMVGRELGGRPARPAPPASAAAPAAPAVELVAGSSGEAFAEVDLALRPGEVASLYGKVGAGALEVAEAIFGMRRLDGGELRVGGRAVRFRHPADAIAAGIGCLPGDRQGQAIFRPRSVAQNLAAPSWRALARGGALVTAGREAAVYRHWHDQLGIRSRNDPAQEIWQLSGGNQQKVVLGRWLQRGSRVLVLVEPTRGVDVGARQEIYRAVRELAAAGSAVLIATSDYEDVVHAADSAAVMVRGRIARRLAGDAITVEALTDAAGGVVHV